MNMAASPDYLCELVRGPASAQVAAAIGVLACLLAFWCIDAVKADARFRAFYSNGIAIDYRGTA